MPRGSTSVFIWPISGLHPAKVQMHRFAHQHHIEFRIRLFALSITHSFTYHRNRYILALCDRSPRVAGNVHCKRQRHSGHPAYGLQIPVHQAHRALILNPRISVGTLYYRKKILASARIVPACNLLHAPFPLHGKPLARFPLLSTPV